MPPGHLAQVLGDRQATIHPNLIVGFEGAEDAGVFRISEDRALVVTTDFFPPMIDDPFIFGRVAAANALSDVYAMGGRPLTALNIVGWPAALDPAILAEILAGGADAVREAKAAIAGGHSIYATEILYGLAVTGEVHPDRIIRNCGMKAGDALLLTKPVGSGLITSSIKKRGNDAAEVHEAFRVMGTLNGTGIEAILEAKPHAMTDITGFGLLGHLSEMLAKDQLAAIVEAQSVPRIRGIEAAFEEKNRTRGAKDNLKSIIGRLDCPEDIDLWSKELLLDPQTSGGLLIALPKAAAVALLPKLKAAGLDQAAIVGQIETSAQPMMRVR